MVGMADAAVEGCGEWACAVGDCAIFTSRPFNFHSPDRERQGQRN